MVTCRRRWIGRFALLLAVGIAGLLVATLPGRAEYDRSKFCRPDAGRVIVLIDVTSPFDERARDVFQRGIAGIVASVAPGQRIVISTIEDSYTAQAMLYEGCVPWCDEGWSDWLTSQCTEGLLRIETKRQLAEIRAGLQKRLATAMSELPKSDILRTLAASIKQRAEDEALDLYVFSDLVENSDFIPAKLFWKEPIPALLNKIGANNLLPDLTQARVKVFGVGRGGSLERQPLPQDRLNKLTEFWASYFTLAGAPTAQIAEVLFVK